MLARGRRRPRRSRCWSATALLGLPEEARAGGRELLAQDGYALLPDGPGRHLAVRTQVLTALSASQERSRMAGLAQRLGGDVAGWDALGPAGPQDRPMSTPDAPSSHVVVVYSDDVAVRDQVRTAVGRRPASDLGRIEWVDCSTGADVVARVDAGGVDRWCSTARPGRPAGWAWPSR